MQMRIEQFPTTRFAHVHARGPYHEVMEGSFRKLGALAGARGLLKPGAMMIAVCHDDPATTRPEEIRSDAALSVDATYAGDAELPVMTIEGGRYAIATHMGDYSGLPAAWQTVMGELIPAAGLVTRDAAHFEHYVNDCTGLKPEQVRTDIYIPVK